MSGLLCNDMGYKGLGAGDGIPASHEDISHISPLLQIR